MDEPCAVCGNTDLKLVDGFYYCVECGTQDTNVQETIVEQTILADGTLQVGTVRKIRTAVEEDTIMSSEWYKWHAFNFMLLGLVEELISLGANPSLKLKVLWIWSRYIKKFQNKEDIQLFSTFIQEEKKTDADSDSSIGRPCDDNRKDKNKKSKKSIEIITTNLLLSILYVATNIDKSDIQLSHLFRFIREGRLSLLSYSKFIPKDIKVKRIPEWKRFESCNRECSRMLIHQNSINLFKVLKLGAPIVPDINKIVDNYVKELCLPLDFRNLVLSLMNLLPCDFLIVSGKDTKSLKKIPDYEVTVMGYVLIALKMTFGLDDDYELKLSDAVDHVNESEDEFLKSYKLGSYSSPSQRLFSFRDWCKHLQLRKIILSRYYLPMAWQNNTEADDYVLMEQSTSRPKGKHKVSDEITMDILSRIPFTEEGTVIPKTEFLPTLTPMTSYTEVILQYFQDPELKLILTEDFTQYSLKYAIEDLSFPLKFDNLSHTVTGVSDSNKIRNQDITGSLVSKKSDFTEVYVRDCDNKNWLKTNPPKEEHVKKFESNIDRESDHGYDSPTNPDDSHIIYNTDYDKTQEDSFNEEDKVKLEFITEEEEGKCIFDDTFENIKEEQTEVPNNNGDVTNFEFNRTLPNQNNDYEHNQDNNDSKSDIFSCISHRREFNPDSFNRQNVIKELVLMACRDYKVPIPKEYNTREPQKRTRVKSNHIVDEATAPKRSRANTKPGTAKQEVQSIISSYYSREENRLLNQISEIVNTLDTRNLRESLATVNNPITQTDNHENTANIVEHDYGSGVVEDNAFENLDADSLNVQDPSVMECSEPEADIDLLPKTDPKFDEATHDIKQLYVKIPDNEDNEDINIEDDVDILKIIEKKIHQFTKGDVEIDEKEVIPPKTIDDSDTDSDYDVPLKVLHEEKLVLLQNLENKKKNLEPLVKKDNITEYNYWVRHYNGDSFRKNQRMNTKFDKELQENFPKSFVFVIQECSSIINCQTFALYKILQNLEKVLMTKISS